MEFEEMKKIWDAQNNEPMYAINEEALFRRIRAKSSRASRISNINEIGLILIVIVTSGILLFVGNQSFYDYLTVFALLSIGLYIWIGRMQRKKRESEFDRSMLGELDQALANVDHETNRAKTFFWWFLLPVAIPAFLNMAQAGTPSWKWFVVPAAFVLSYFVVQWGLKRKQLPRKKELEALRKILADE